MRLGNSPNCCSHLQILDFPRGPPIPWYTRVEGANPKVSSTEIPCRHTLVKGVILEYLTEVRTNSPVITRICESGSVQML